MGNVSFREIPRRVKWSARPSTVSEQGRFGTSGERDDPPSLKLRCDTSAFAWLWRTRDGMRSSTEDREGNEVLSSRFRGRSRQECRSYLPGGNPTEPWLSARPPFRKFLWGITSEAQVNGFEIVGFGESGRVIGGVAGGLQFLEWSTGWRGGLANGSEKFFRRNMR